LPYLTGSKNALKGVGFFLGGALLSLLGFNHALLAMASVLGLVWLSSLVLLKEDLGKKKAKPKFSELFSKSRAINFLSAARLFLFAARDVWFVVALPVYLSTQLGWRFLVGGWIFGVMDYCLWRGAVFCTVFNRQKTRPRTRWHSRLLYGQIALCGVTCGLIALSIKLMVQFSALSVIVLGLLSFGVLFAVNSSLHSYLIVSYAQEDGVSLDVGFYYMSNAMGRLLGTVLSGWVYQQWGLVACLWISSAFIALAAIISLGLPKHKII
jgi:MFS family permease